MRSVNISTSSIRKTIEALLRANVWKATNYISDKMIVRASHRLLRGKLSNIGNLEIVVSVGRPNYAERAFIAACKKAGEPFPVKKIQLKYPPKIKK